MTFANWLVQATARLQEAGSTTPRLDALLLAEKAYRLDRALLLAGPDRSVPKTLEKLLNRRRQLEPMAYILGYKEFYGISFKVNRFTLIPRPETEAIVAWTVAEAPRGAKILDLGTGCGAIGLSIKQHRSDLLVHLSDLSSATLTVAKQNAKMLELDNLHFWHSDLMQNIDTKFDIVLANLPYLKPGERTPELAYEPSGALYSGSDGLRHYKRLHKELVSKLYPGGKLLLEHSPEQFVSLDKIFTGLTRVSDFVSLKQY